MENYWQPDCPYPVLDPLQCYCKPITCDYNNIILPNCAEFVDSRDVLDAKTVLPNQPNYNSLHINCDHESDICFDPTYGKNGQVTVSCNFNQDINGNNLNTVSWIGQDDLNCVKLGCVNPRNANSMLEVVSPSLNMKHTCRAVDHIRLPSDTEFKNVKDRLVTDNDLFFAGEHATSNPKTSIFGDDLFLIDATNSDVNVVEGSKYQFTCKKGYKPVYNSKIAMEMGKFSDTLADVRQFICTCLQGKWVCNHFCKCENENICDLDQVMQLERNDL